MCLKQPRSAAAGVGAKKFDTSLPAGVCYVKGLSDERLLI